MLERGTTYYFKVQPIEWRVLTSNYNSTGKKLLLAESILTANVPYYYLNSGTRSIDDDTTVYPNNYKYSQIRAYLNGLNYYNNSNTAVTTYNEKGFLQKAFTTSAQDLIETTAVDNSAASTTDSSGAVRQATTYACENTSDKIFLLSEKEVTTSTYGFAAYNSSGTFNTRIRVTTDYAKANMAYQSTTSGRGGNWRLRSPDYSYSEYVRSVRDYGDTYTRSLVFNSYHGVCPALCVE
ncbi:MAG: DUF6273 domain-containing protein [Treponema sp.]|nr:DUF6273 domain-containing protein [Treponema sp.]